MQCNTLRYCHLAATQRLTRCVTSTGALVVTRDMLQLLKNCRIISIFFSLPLGVKIAGVKNKDKKIN